jgi:predicted dehydrogenase
MSVRNTIVRRALSSSAASTTARVLVAGAGRMGKIRASLVQSNPRLELAGIVDPIWENGKALADVHGVRRVESKPQSKLLVLFVD